MLKFHKVHFQNLPLHSFEGTIKCKIFQLFFQFIVRSHMFDILSIMLALFLRNSFLLELERCFQKGVVERIWKSKQAAWVWNGTQHAEWSPKQSLTKNWMYSSKFKYKYMFVWYFNIYLYHLLKPKISRKSHREKHLKYWLPLHYFEITI